MSAVAKLWYKKCLNWIEDGMDVEEAISKVPMKWQDEVFEALVDG